MLAYNCSPSFNWSNLSDDDIASFQKEIGKMGYKFQFITLAGFHSLNYSMYELSRGYRDRGMAAIRASECRIRRRGTWLYRTPPPARGWCRLV